MEAHIKTYTHYKTTSTLTHSLRHNLLHSLLYSSLSLSLALTAHTHSLSSAKNATILLCPPSILKYCLAQGKKRERVRAENGKQKQGSATHSLAQRPFTISTI